ncbi:Lrp/AsnC family transcriptional regulator [Amycolatopsis sp. NPDC051903]|uniref:Lrp/AsnC family transcriptional regulator n=1 Tax=Amycolatopsis sp. NPDC051903 TaxID=3363936 RepID=UPI003787A75F
MSEADRRIVAALQVNGRASWRKVATALDVAESTVTRRGQQLLADRVVAVTGVLDHLRCGLGISVYMRLRMRPGHTPRVARAVAGSPKARFVTVLTGTFDVAAEVVVERHHDIVDVINAFEAIDNVVDIESLVVIRKFSAFEEWLPATLSARAVDVLRAGSEVTDYAHRAWTEPEQLTEQEFAIADVLAGNGRATYATIAARTGVSESTAGRRVESLVERGCLRFRTVFEPPVLGYAVEYLLWLSVDPAQLEEVGMILAKHPASRYVAAATGPHNLIVQGVLPGYGDLYPYTTDVVGRLRGLRSADLAMQVQVLKRAWVPVDDDGKPRDPGAR